MARPIIVNRRLHSEFLLGEAACRKKPSRDHCWLYQSEYIDQRVHERHCVEVHWWRQAGHTPLASKVFHRCPQLHDQRSSLRGDQPQSGHRMRGPDGSLPFC